MTQFFNRKSEKETRQRLRNSMTAPETLLWSRLRNGQVCGVRFRRQHSIGPFIVDFHCPRLKLAIEVDGESHFVPGAETSDADRQAYIESFGIKVLRFTNRDVMDNVEGVMSVIAGAVAERRGLGKDPLWSPFIRGTESN